MFPGLLLCTVSIALKDKDLQGNQLRKASNMRAEDLANALGMSRLTIIEIENDKYNPALELAMKIARLFRQPVESIFFLED